MNYQTVIIIITEEGGVKLLGNSLDLNFTHLFRILPWEHIALHSLERIDSPIRYMHLLSNLNDFVGLNSVDINHLYFFISFKANLF